MRRISIDLYEELIQNGVLSTPALLNDEAIREWGTNNNNVIRHYESYLDVYQQPDSIGPIEKHPYIEFYENDFDLSRRFLLLGTFPPSSYFNNLGLEGLPNVNIQPNNPLNYYPIHASSAPLHLDVQPLAAAERATMVAYPAWI